MAHALVTTTVETGRTIRVTMDDCFREYEWKYNRFDSAQESHAAAAMQFVRDFALGLDYPKWACGTITRGPSPTFVFVPGAAAAHVNTYDHTFRINLSGEIHYR